MRVLTDTHALVWALSDSEALSPAARDALAHAEVLASVANLWELLVKRYKKDALLADPISWWEKYIIGASIPTLGIRVGHVLTLGRLVEVHKDPFDRILVAQAISEKVALVSKDAQLARYGVATIW